MGMMLKVLFSTALICGIMRTQSQILIHEYACIY